MAVEPWRVPELLWREIEPLILRPQRRFRYPGRKRLDDRACLEGILYVALCDPLAGAAEDRGTALRTDMLAAAG